MNKVKIYRRIGFPLLIIMILGELINFCQPQKFQYFVSHPSEDFLPALWGCMAVIVLNPFIWAGVLLLWRADVNDGKTFWLKVLKGYGILTILTVLIIAGRILKFF